MTDTSYILYIERPTQNGAEFLLPVFNIAGRGYTFCGSNDEFTSRSLWFIFKGKNTPEVIKEKLEAEESIKAVSVATISNPVKESELTDVRLVFEKMNWDTRDISNDDLTAFINAKIQGRQTHYIDMGNRRWSSAPHLISIKPIQEHPNFSPDMLKNENQWNRIKDLPDKEFTKDDLKIKTEIISETVAVNIEKLNGF